MEDWAAEAFIGNNAEETVAMNAAAIGGVRVFKRLVTLIEGDEGPTEGV